MTLTFLLISISFAALAENPIGSIANQQQEMFHLKAFQSQAATVLSKWSNLVHSQKAKGRFLIDANDVIPILKSQNKISYMYGIKTKCKDDLKPNGKLNTVDWYSSNFKSSGQPEAAAVFNQVRKFFDDPQASCKAPTQGFDLIAVTQLKPGELDVTTNEKRELRNLAVALK